MVPNRATHHNYAWFKLVHSYTNHEISALNPSIAITVKRKICRISKPSTKQGLMSFELNRKND